MPQMTDREHALDVIEQCRYMTLATTDGESPWVATIEHMRDQSGVFYFFSTEDSRHARDIASNSRVAISLYSGEQPEYSPDANARLRGVQIEATARKLTEDEYPDFIRDAIEALQAPMPPYAVFRVDPARYYLPKLENGVNVREEVNV